MIEVRDLHKSYCDLEVLKGIDLRVERGEVVSIVGASGAGKSTLLQIMGTLMRADRGSIFVDETDISTLDDDSLSCFRNTKIGFVFQFHHLLGEFTALENVCLPALIAGIDRYEVESRGVELLKMLGVSHRCSHKPSALSGGEQQRVAVARALINSPLVLFADEPSGNLDSVSREELHRMFFDIRDSSGQTIVLVTHDESLASMADRRLVMVDGRFC